MGPPSEVTGGICQDLASFAIFFDLREAHFQHFSPRIEAVVTAPLGSGAGRPPYLYVFLQKNATTQKTRGR